MLFTRRQFLLISLGAVLVVSAVCGFYSRWTYAVGQPICHKVFDTVLRSWHDEAGSQEFPNVNGSSEESLAVLTPMLGDDISDRYLYVPGLCRDDPGDLVLMYVRQPTRWISHGSFPSMFAEKAWLIVPVDMKIYGSRPNLTAGEFSERLSDREFRRRLLKTLEHLKSKKPDHWEAITQEHSNFLKSIGSAG